ncbi:MAG: cytochrome c [Saprospiraceae bacterium]|nr:cytochrome c [Saprospiraceae bacterium]
MKVRFVCFSFFLLLQVACQQQTYQIGQRLYQTHCANCHMDNGTGLGALIPPLAGSDYLQTHRDQLPCIIQHGLMDTIVVNGQLYAEKMQGVKGLSEIQITNISNYVIQTWGNKSKPFTLEEVGNTLKNCKIQ